LETKQQSDAVIIAKVLEGDTRAFALLIDRYKNPISSIIMNMTADVHMTEEIAQNTFVRLYRFLDKYKGESSLKTFVSRIAINLTLNALKKRKKNRERMIHIDGDVLQLKASTMNRDDQLLVHQALLRLNTEQRTLIILRMIEGYTTKETAKIMGIKEGTVMSRMSRTMGTLKDILKDLGHEG